MRTVFAVALAGLAALVAVSHTDVLQRRAQFPKDQDLLYVPAPTWLQAMSLGYREALADLLWIRALVFSGGHVGEDEIGWTFRYVDAINSLAPRFHRPYTWGGVMAVYGGKGAVTRRDVEDALAVYERGVAQFPESHELLYSFAMLLLHQIPNTRGFSDEEIQSYRRQGIDLIRRAAAFGADPLVRQYAATLISEDAQAHLAIQFLEAQLLETDDEAYRRLLRAKLARLAGQDALRSIETLHADFVAERNRLAPYVPESLWAVIRPEIDARPGGPTDERSD